MIKRIIGIDPGSRATGLGLIETNDDRLSVLEYGIIKTENYDFALRLKTIFMELDKILDKHRPDEFAIENVFVNKNVNSALKLGQARGVAIVAAARRDIPVFEYSPNEIKKSVVGKGHADKNQVQVMTYNLLGLKTIPPSDAADALACAICHINTSKFLNYVKSNNK